MLSHSWAGSVEDTMGLRGFMWGMLEVAGLEAVDQFSLNFVQHAMTS